MMLLLALLQTSVVPPREEEESSFAPYRTCVLAAAADVSGIQKSISDIKIAAKSKCSRERTKVEFDIAVSDAASRGVTRARQKESPYYRYHARDHLKEMDRHLSNDIKTAVLEARSGLTTNAAN